jgi:nicotinic acid mononucleotide adenylyltransferase
LFNESLSTSSENHFFSFILKALLIFDFPMPKALEKFIGSELGQVKTLAWFGFAADPPTIAHRAVLDATLGSGIVQKIVVFPAGKLPYKDFQATDWQRNDMTEIWKAAASFGDEVILSRFDLEREQAITWIELLEKIGQMSSIIKHWFVLGSDQYLEIPKSWDRGEELLEQANILIVPRVGHDVDPQRDNHLLLKVPAIPGSSTEVRAGDFKLLDEKVREYVVEEGLYGTEQS